MVETLDPQATNPTCFPTAEGKDLIPKLIARMERWLQVKGVTKLPQPFIYWLVTYTELAPS